MILDRDIKKYSISKDASIIEALKKIELNKHKTLFIVSPSDHLEGSLTDGDIRRWLVSSEKTDLSISVELMMNSKFYSIQDRNIRSIDLESKLKEFSVIPVIDSTNKFIKVAVNELDKILINNDSISQQSPTYIIAEIGNNHNGSKKLAKQLAKLAKESGANCAKFQMRDLSSLYINKGDSSDASQDLGSQYTMDLLSKFQLSNEDLFEVFDYCYNIGITPLCTPWDIESINQLEKYGVEAFKVASADLTNHELLEELSKTGKPLICSTGMSIDSEILETSNFLKNRGVPFCMLHCNSTYPTPTKDINLSYIRKLESMTNTIIGYSSHDRGNEACLAAVAMGAKIIEKHFTIDKSMEGNDHKVSLLPDEMKSLVDSIRSVELAIGNSSPRKLSQGELINREVLGKSIYFRENCTKGELITDSMLEIKGPGQGISPNKKIYIVGSKATKDFVIGDIIHESDLETSLEEKIIARDYSFNRPFGIPVRYHDFQKLAFKSKMDIVEFHLSYKDLEINPADFLDGQYHHSLVVHSPELFKGDHIMDLCSISDSVTKRSLNDLKTVVNITKELSKFFLGKEKPKIVINVGGFSMDSPIDPELKHNMYEAIAKNLKEADCPEVDLIPQTMPPYPWHFGGQRFHNLFVDPDEIKTFCEKNNFSICFDISHSQLACNENNWSFTKFTETVAPFTNHIHIGDAKDSDGEGLQIGDGNLDFYNFFKIFNNLNKHASFIPEVWQGHKNDGEGFWYALDLLEDYSSD